MHSMSSIMFVVSGHGENVFITLPDPKGHVRFVITERPSSFSSSSVNFYILIFFSKTNWNQTWKECLLDSFVQSHEMFCRSELEKKQDTQRCQQKSVHIYRYTIFISHLFLMSIFATHAVKKFLSETCITVLYNLLPF
jgi:hypothetical protein